MNKDQTLRRGADDWPRKAAASCMRACLWLCWVPVAAQDRWNDQVTQGAQLYTSKCAICHGRKLEGLSAPALRGRDFLGKWAGNTADDLYYIISSQMPLTAPSSLAPEEYLMITAFVLRSNEISAAATSLAPTQLKSITITRPDGKGDSCAKDCAALPH